MKSAILALLGACAVAAPATAQVLSGTGTAVIDGVIDNQEWIDAAAPLFLVNTPGGTEGAALYVMNDATNLYFGLVVVYLGGAVDLSVEFDASGDDETLTAGDDGIGCYSLNDAARDGYRTESMAPSDTSGGGSIDVACASSTTAVSTYIEMSHPLDSGDGRDIAVGPGATLPFFASIRVFPGSHDTYYPGPGAGIEAQIEIVPEPTSAASAVLVSVVLWLLRRRAAAVRG